ncbi:DUF308 domain-containing protein [bacterium]|nr:DUF308 domain-containing protein [bacterium]
MTEKRLLNFIFIEGVLLMILGLCVLILPKLTNITFGVMLSSSFIAYGGYKLITSLINKNYINNVVWSIFLGIYILTIGILLLCVPKVNLLWLIALIGVYFLLESISSVAFIAKMRSIFNLIGCKGIVAIVLFLVGISIIIGLPVISFWTVAILAGIAMLVKGMSKISLSLANRNVF